MTHTFDYYIDRISIADSVDELDSIVEIASEDDELGNDEYCKICETATAKYQSWHDYLN